MEIPNIGSHSVIGVHKFDNTFLFTEFISWMRATEKENRISFVSMREAYKVKGGTKKILYCNRSGYFVPKGNNMRQRKSQGG